MHFNVWLDGEYVDPFAAAGETPIWRDGNDPKPCAGSPAAEPFEPTAWDARVVDQVIASCLSPEVRVQLGAEPELDRRAMNVLFQRSYYPTRFGIGPRLFAEVHPREARLSLPFRSGNSRASRLSDKR